MSLAIVCGKGALPSHVAAAQKTAPLICVLEGFAPDGLGADVTFRLETLGSLLEDLGARGVSEVCFAGGIDRPALDPSKLDGPTTALLPMILPALQSGDDSALRIAAGIFEQKGFAVRGADELAPDLLVGAGVLGAAQPDAQMQKDATLGAGILAALAPFDVAQACVVGAGQLLGVETVAGTDAMLDGLPAASARAKAILVKGPKTGQDARLDTPTIGPDTIDALARAGAKGLVIEAGRVIVLAREEVIARADAAGLVLWSRAPDGAA
jgi:DUF1009 family protein